MPSPHDIPPTEPEPGRKGRVQRRWLWGILALAATFWALILLLGSKLAP